MKSAPLPEEVRSRVRAYERVTPQAQPTADSNDALQMLAEKGIVNLDDERRAAMVSNLMVVLCSEQNTQPVVNAGTLYT